jgi:hypothetical protein
VSLSKARHEACCRQFRPPSLSLDERYRDGRHCAWCCRSPSKIGWHCSLRASLSHPRAEVRRFPTNFQRKRLGAGRPTAVRSPCRVWAKFAPRCGHVDDRDRHAIAARRRRRGRDGDAMPLFNRPQVSGGVAAASLPMMAIAINIA